MPRKRSAKPRQRFVPSFKIIEVDPTGFGGIGLEDADIGFSPKVHSDKSDRCTLWLRVGHSMRLMHMWQNPMAYRFCAIDDAGKMFEYAKVH